MDNNVKSLADFANIQKNPNHKAKLIVLFFFHPLDEACNRMQNNLVSWSEHDKYRDRVLFVKCNQESSNQDIFEKYNVEEIPTFLFIENSEQVVECLTGFDARRTAIEKIMNDFVNGKT